MSGCGPKIKKPQRPFRSCPQSESFRHWSQHGLLPHVQKPLSGRLAPRCCGHRTAAFRWFRGGPSGTDLPPQPVDRTAKAIVGATSAAASSFVLSIVCPGSPWSWCPARGGLFNACFLRPPDEARVAKKRRCMGARDSEGCIIRSPTLPTQSPQGLGTLVADRTPRDVRGVKRQ
jgi:hypothetical protein